MEASNRHSRLEYWLQWQVLVSSLVLILPATVASILFMKRGNRRNYRLHNSDFWAPCWRNLHPRWLLFYRLFSFASMTFLLYQTVAAFGFVVFFFYTQWTFVLVTVYFALATVVSARGCWINLSSPSGARGKFLGHHSDDSMHEGRTSSMEKHSEGLTNVESAESVVGFLENLLHIIYQTCAGAVMLTDIVFWFLLLPFMAGDTFQLTLLIGCMHSVNALFLLIESVLNRLPFHWFGFVYFVLWSCAYILFQWVVQACCISWWPYPFLELSTPWAPMWYLALALVHVPCYGLYFLIVKAKDASFSRMFTNTFTRVSIEKKLV